MLRARGNEHKQAMANQRTRPGNYDMGLSPWHKLAPRASPLEQPRYSKPCLPHDPNAVFCISPLLCAKLWRDRRCVWSQIRARSYTETSPMPQSTAYPLAIVVGAWHRRTLQPSSRKRVHGSGMLGGRHHCPRNQCKHGSMFPSDLGRTGLMSVQLSIGSRLHYTLLEPAKTLLSGALSLYAAGNILREPCPKMQNAPAKCSCRWMAMNDQNHHYSSSNSTQ